MTNEIDIKGENYRWILLSTPEADTYDNEPRLDRRTGEPLWRLDLVQQPISGGSGEVVRCRVPASGLKGLPKGAVMVEVVLAEPRVIAYNANNGRARLALRATGVAVKQ